jgi:hypothetical protein
MRRINRYIPIQLQNYFYEKKEPVINKEELKQWKLNGCPVPPPHSAKQIIIEKYAKLYGCEIFIETGTYLGDTIFSQKGNFKRLLSVELAKKLYRSAVRRFKKYSHIEIFFGNSGDLLFKIMPEIKIRSLLWLDGHYSGGLTARGKTESPVFKELDAVFANNKLNHVILIDDARLFIGQRDYPTIEELTDYVKSKNPEYNVKTETDIIILTIL